jgi:hypothetical protein
VQNLGLRAYRRPLTDVEVSRYVNLFNQGPSLIGSMDAFADGAELLITYLLQSPHFLYRAELSTGAVAGKVPLGDYEVASRLSYGLPTPCPMTSSSPPPRPGSCTRAKTCRATPSACSPRARAGDPARLPRAALPHPAYST